MARFILNHDHDNVVTALTPMETGEALRLGNGGPHEITVKEPIPFAHKCAIRNIRRGEKVIKYGESIGVATCDIEAGEHVHVHNLQSVRGSIGGK